MSLLNVNALSHSFGEKELYREASFTLNRGEHMGLVGQNGTGKSTLIKILLGEIIPGKGNYTWRNGVTIGHIGQYAQADESLTIEQYLHSAYEHLYETERLLQKLYSDMGTQAGEKQLRLAGRYQTTLDEGDFYAIDSTISRVATGLGLSAIGVKRPLGGLSGGQRTKVLLAKLLLTRPDVLLLDEPTNFLDTEHIAWLSEYLRAFEGSFIIVSHDFSFLDHVTNCICDIEFLAIKKYSGKYSDFVRQKQRRREDYIRQYDAQKREVDRLEEFITRNKARTSTARMAKSRQKKLDKMDKLAPPSVLPKPNIAFSSPGMAITQRALTAKGLLVGYDKALLPEMNFYVEGGKKIAVTGFNGIGKSTLFKTLCGIMPALGGTYKFESKIKIGYFEQDLLWEDASISPLDLLLSEYPNLPPKQVRNALARCAVTAKRALQPISTLSGGEQNKVKLCRLTLKTFDFLILDEPTNHLDAETKESLALAIMKYEGTVLLACHEKDFYEGWIDGVIDIEKLLVRHTRSM